MKTTTVTRKEIAVAADVSEDTVARKEKLWGLDACRAMGRKKPVAFFRDQVNQRLIAGKIISKPL